MTEIKLNTDKHDIDDLIRYLDGDHHMGVYDRAQVIKDLKAQLPKPAIEEPKQFGSVVLARADHFSWDKQEPVPWLYDGSVWRAEGDEWASVWKGLRDVEVLRVGIGEDLDAPWRAQQQLCNTILTRLRRLHSDAITAERKGGLQRAIEFVEGLKP